MEESTTYQYIIEQGELKGLRAAVLDLGRGKFGPPARRARAAILEIEDLTRLRHLLMRVLSANSWDELLETP